MPLTPEELKDPKVFENSIWRMLARGAVDSKDAFKLMTLSTVTEENLPDARTVVLRACDIGAKELCFHTDIRSSKITHLQIQPQVCLLFWNPRVSIQLRVYGNCQVHHLDNITKEKLTSLSPQQLALYGFGTAPGTKLAQGNDLGFDENLVGKNFAWVQVKVQRIDSLHLGRNGMHTRVLFQYDANGLLSSEYLQP